MEAEAQCATLEELGLVDGVITDDSDVFLFGAQRVFKNIFEQTKYVESYRATDIATELHLDRKKLICTQCSTPIPTLEWIQSRSECCL